jgi:hypothetical protein
MRCRSLIPTNFLDSVLSWQQNSKLRVVLAIVGVHMRQHFLQKDVNRGASSSTAQMKEMQCSRIAEFREQLVQSGFATLGKQAAALGLGRSTCWNVLRGAHKASGLTPSILARMLGSPQLPPAVRVVILRYIDEKCRGLYGHSVHSIRRFRTQLQKACPDQLFQGRHPALVGDVEQRTVATAVSPSSVVNVQPAMTVDAPPIVSESPISLYKRETARS